MTWIIPAILVAGIGALLACKAVVSRETIQGFLPYVVGLMATLIGFTITCVTILTTSSSPNVDEIRTITDDRVPRTGDSISIYQWVLTQFSFLLILEFACLAFNLLYGLLLAISRFTQAGKLFLVLDSYLLLTIIIINLSNIGQFYMVFWRGDIKHQPPTK